MFEKISGFFKRFTSRRQRQSGETTIMNGKEPGVDDFGLDEGFGDLDDAGMSVGDDSGGFDSEPAFSDADFGTEEGVISTGGTDFEEKTISDEVAGLETGMDSDLVEAGEEVPGGFPAQDDMMGLGEEPMAEAEPVPLKKKMVTLAVVAVVGIFLGGVIQMFLWPIIGNMMAGESAQPKMDQQAELGSMQRANAKLKKELQNFKGVGDPKKAKAANKQLANLRKSQGSMKEFNAAFQAVQDKEAEYDNLVARIGVLESDVDKTRTEIVMVESQIEEALRRVEEVKAQSEQEYERFKLETVRAELSQCLLMELQHEDIESFREEIAGFEENLSRLTPPDFVKVSTGTDSSPEDL